MKSLSYSIVFLTTVLGLSTTASAQIVRQVDATGANGAFTTIQAAIDNAAEGDVILVKDGVYGGFSIDGKALRIAADVGAQPVLLSNGAGAPTAHLSIANLASTQFVELDGLLVRAGSPSPLGFAGPLTRIVDCSGPVLIQNCVFEVTNNGFNFSNANGLSVEGSSAVTIVRSSIDLTAPNSVTPSSALSAIDSSVYVYDSDLIGAPGKTQIGVSGEPGTEAIDIVGGEALIVGSSLTGGRGGDGNLAPRFMICSDAGDGSPAVVLRSGATQPVFRISDSLLTSGAPGQTAGLCLPGLVVSDPIDHQAGTIDLLPRSFRSTELTPVARVGDTMTLRFEGEPFDLVWNLLSLETTTTVVYMPEFMGAVYPGGASQLFFRGSLGANGMKNRTFTLNDIGFDVATLYLQTFYYNPIDGITVSNPQISVLMDASTP